MQEPQIGIRKRVCFEDTDEQVFEGTFALVGRCDDWCGTVDRRPEYMGSNAAYGIRPDGSERLVFKSRGAHHLVTTCFHYDLNYLRAILLALILGGIELEPITSSILSAHESVNLWALSRITFLQLVDWLEAECNCRKTAGATGHRGKVASVFARRLSETLCLRRHAHDIMRLIFAMFERFAGKVPMLRAICRAPPCLQFTRHGAKLALKI